MTNSEGAKPAKVEQTAPLLLTSDLTTSRDFYCDGLGFSPANSWESEGKLAWCWLQHGGAALMLQQACDQDPPPADWGKGLTMYFICEDADAVYRELRDRGIKATEPKDAFYGMRQTFVTDPDGYQLCFENPTHVA